MRRVKRISLLLASFALMSLVAWALAASLVAAQTMGEYGMAVGHAAGAGVSAPKVAPPPLPSQPSANDNPAGSTQADEVRTYDEPGASDANDDKDAPSNESGGDDWVQTK